MLAAGPFPAARGTPNRTWRIGEEPTRRGNDVDVTTYQQVLPLDPLLVLGAHTLLESEMPYPVHEDNALIARDGDVDAFSAASLRLVGDWDFARRPGRNAQNHVRSRMAWPHPAAAIGQVYGGVNSGVAWH